MQRLLKQMDYSLQSNRKDKEPWRQGANLSISVGQCCHQPNSNGEVQCRAVGTGLAATRDLKDPTHILDAVNDNTAGRTQ